MSTPPKLDLLDIFKGDADTLLQARAKAKLVHKSGNIDASGDEVEMGLRALLAGKVARSVLRRSGPPDGPNHTVSPQIDLIIADRAATPILFRTENNTDYVPYECVFAIGEAETSYARAKKPIQAFSEVLKAIRTNLQRDKTPTNYLGQGLSLGPGLSSGDQRPYKNPLYSFMFFGGGDTFNMADVAQLYREEAAENLPNAVCILNQGILLNARFEYPPGAGPKQIGLNVVPEFNKAAAEQFDRWAFLPYGTPETRSAHCLGVLWFLLSEHIRSCVLLEPNLSRYLKSWGAFEHGEVLDLPPPPTVTVPPTK